MKEKYIVKIGYKCPLQTSDHPDFKDGKRFCELCSKNVYDLRGLSDQEIYSLAKGQKSICGRIQADRVSEVQNSQEGFFRKILTGFAIFAFITNAFSQRKYNDTLRTQEIEGLALVSMKYEDSSDDDYSIPKRKLTGGFKTGEKSINNSVLLKLNQSSVTEGIINSYGEIDFSIDEYLVKERNIVLIPVLGYENYRYKIIRKELFDQHIDYYLNDTHIVKTKFPKKNSSENLYYIDGEEVDYEEFSETVKIDQENFLYFLLPPELAEILLEKKTKKNLYIAYSR